jgi:hypothetical protein
MKQLNNQINSPQRLTLSVTDDSGNVCIEQYKVESAEFSAILLFGQLEWSFAVETFSPEGNSVSIEANKILHNIGSIEELTRKPLQIPYGYDENREEHLVTMYYVEHVDADNNMINFIQQDGEYYSVKWTGESTECEELTFELNAIFKFKGIKEIEEKTIRVLFSPKFQNHSDTADNLHYQGYKTQLFDAMNSDNMVHQDIEPFQVIITMFHELDDNMSLCERLQALDYQGKVIAICGGLEEKEVTALKEMEIYKIFNVDSGIDFSGEVLPVLDSLCKVQDSDK